MHDTDEAYQTHILQGVSRTFALTIPQLPPHLCKVVGNAYLLCRIADTIEDEPILTIEQKQYFSDAFIQVVAGEISPQNFAHELVPLLSDATSVDEKDLIQNTPRVIHLTHNFTEIQQAALYRCVQIMAHGMADFQRNASPHGLKDLKAMDDYCYYVAGVVGEMLTDLFCDYSPEIDKNREQLQKLAISFGQGLQMTNILKDIWEDLERGVCWLPRDIFQQVGFDLSNLSPDIYDEKFGNGLEKLIGIAHKHLYNSLSYVLLIPSHEKGIRRFCLWALGMAILTLRKINTHREFKTGQHVKISRRSVKATIISTNLATRSDFTLKTLFYILTRNLPKK